MTRMGAVLLVLSLLAAPLAAAPRKAVADTAGHSHQSGEVYHGHNVNFFDSFFSFFGDYQSTKEDKPTTSGTRPYVTPPPAKPLSKPLLTNTIRPPVIPPRPRPVSPAPKQLPDLPPAPTQRPDLLPAPLQPAPSPAPILPGRSSPPSSPSVQPPRLPDQQSSESRGPGQTSNFPPLSSGKPETLRPQAPVSRPQAPAPRPLVAPARPQAPASRPQAPASRPQAPGARPPAPAPYPQAPAPRPKVPAPWPQAPAAASSQSGQAPRRPQAPATRPNRFPGQPRPSQPRPSQPRPSQPWLPADQLQPTSGPSDQTSGLPSQPPREPSPAPRIPGQSEPSRLQGQSEPSRIPGRSEPSRLPGQSEPSRIPGRSEPSRLPGQAVPSFKSEPSRLPGSGQPPFSRPRPSPGFLPYRPSPPQSNTSAPTNQLLRPSVPVPYYPTFPAPPSYYSPFPVPPPSYPTFPPPPPSYSPFPPPPQETCVTPQGEEGLCRTTAQCTGQQGQAGGPCRARHPSQQPRVCCVFSQDQCGYQTNHRVSYFKSSQEQEQTRPASCAYRVNLLPGVCQIRLDFLDLQLAGMEGGVCDPGNRLAISTGPGQVSSVPVSQLCGAISRAGDSSSEEVPHLYIHWDREARPRLRLPNMPTTPYLKLEVKVSGRPASWNMKVTQVSCDGSSLQAPPGCAQWFNSRTGNMTSLNLHDGQYQAGLNMVSCLVREPSSCAVKFKLRRMQVGPTRGGGLGYGLVCGDYLKFLGERTGLCGGGGDREVVLPIRGPLGVALRTDLTHVPGKDVGFELSYSFLQDCRGLQYFQYPGGQ